MGYGSGDHFHARSIEVITDYLVNDPAGKVAGTRTITSNAAPTVNAGPNRTIPALTPFELTGSATDDNTGLTYAWEQYDLGDADLPGVDDGDGPLFRTPCASSPTRSFPILYNLLDNYSDVNEYLPQVSRVADPLTFRLTVRDGLGGVNSDDVDLTVQATGSTFALTSHNTAGGVISLGSPQTITWDVAGTNAAAFDAANVAVFISYDNGATFVPLIASTPNNGSATFTLPPNGPVSTTARIKIKPLNNVFYDINNAPITIVDPTVSTVPAAPVLATVSDTGRSNSDRLINRDNSSSAKTIQFIVSGVTSGATVSIYSAGVLIGSAVASGTSVTVTTNGSVDIADGVRTFTTRQTQPGKSQSPHSPASLSITIDTVAPALVAGSPELEFQSVKPRLAYTYNESITFGNGSANVVQTAGNYWLDGWSSSASGSTGTIAFPWVPNGVLPTGRYLATLGADRFQDYAGNSSAASSFAFWFLAADINRDQVVNFGDLLILAQNYGAIGRTFGQGNVDYSTDGSVNFGDLLLLAHATAAPCPSRRMQSPLTLPPTSRRRASA